MADDYRQRIAEAMLTLLRRTVPSEYDLADAVLAVPHPELEQLRADLADLNDLVTRERAIHIEAIRNEETANAAIARARLLHPTPAELVETHAQSDTLCTTCISPAPCPTRRALDGED